MRSVKRWALGAAALLGLGATPGQFVAAAAGQAAAPATSAAPAPQPAIWVIEDEDTKIYLFGTVHVFPASLNWRSAALNRVIAEADELVMETPNIEDATPDMVAAMKLMQLGKSVPILDRVSPGVRPQLEAVLETTGLPMEVFDAMTTWGVAFAIMGFQMSQAGDSKGRPEAMSGAEQVLGRLFRDSRRPVSGVETAEEQIRIFASMPVGAQRRFLEYTVTGGGQTTQEDLTTSGWVRGNVEAIAAEMNAMPAELHAPLLTQRNRNWTGWLRRRMARPGVVLFAVGAGHLAGPGSVQDMLAEQGIAARRLN